MTTRLHGGLPQLAVGMCLLLSLAGCGGAPTGTRALAGPPQQALAARNAQSAAIDASVGRVTRRSASHDNSFRMYLDGPDSYGELFEMIRGAKRSIWISSFEYHADVHGLAMTTLLGAKARAGVEVKLLVDKVGGNLEKGTQDYLRLVREAGGEAREYPTQWVNGFVGIDHRKLFIVDGTVAMTGGMNIGDMYYEDFHDTLGTVRGGAVRDMAREFFRDWKRAGGQAPASLPDAVRDGDTSIRVLTTSGPEGRTEIFDGLAAAIGAAKDHINVAVPYFSDDDLVEVLEDAAAEGVKVRLLLPDIETYSRVDVGILFNYLNPASARKLLAAGAEVWFYRGKKLHLKVFEIDDAWVCYGSANGDTMSFLRNQELSLAIADPAVAQDVRKRLFEADLALSRRVTEKDLQLRPAAQAFSSALDALSYYFGVKPGSSVYR
ncbi:MAG: phosphatidylserine/phosphatidylglycerophosphate/cardiolipin synthase family protein [Candidatus Sericytochromatia bacterium]|nr:phosphatidylserine/phosphatidylglycerophosphate/cardiolipin synthase family protein [Candidatus Tanganyikabacteria bacterium]